MFYLMIDGINAVRYFELIMCANVELNGKVSSFSTLEIQFLGCEADDCYGRGST